MMTQGFPSSLPMPDGDACTAEPAWQHPCGRGSIRLFELALFLLCGALGYAAFRLGLLWAYGKPLGEYRAGDLLPVFGMGARFDLKVLAIVALLLWLLGWIGTGVRALRHLPGRLHRRFAGHARLPPPARGQEKSAAPRRSRGRLPQDVPHGRLRRGLRHGSSCLWQHACGWYGLLYGLLALLNLLAVILYGYFGFYRSMFDPILFGLFDDDTLAVLRTVWGYPVLRMLAVALGLSALQTWVIVRGARSLARSLSAGLARWQARCARCVALATHWSTRLVLQLGALLGLALLARGSLGTFPLIAEDATVGKDTFLNAITQNAPSTLFDAYTVYVNQIRIDPDSMARVLTAHGFHTIHQLADALGHPLSTEQQGWPLPRVLDSLVYRTLPPAAPAGSPAAARAEGQPNVVFVQMESWGEYFLRFHSAHNDLLGELEKHLAAGYVFRNFTSATPGTFPTLEFLLFHSPLTPLTQGRIGLCPLPLSAVRPFKEAGYRTVFIYGGSGQWRAVGRTMPHQYFDEVYDQGDILAHFPAANHNPWEAFDAPIKQLWGAYDEYLFRFAENLLRNPNNLGDTRPVFLYLVTTTNHPPYAPPPDYRALPLDPSVFAAESAYSPAETLAALQTYQYSSRQLGRFLDTIAAEPWGARTILAATGDHNMRAFFRLEQPARMRDLITVPAYLRIPPAWRPRHMPDLQRYASHKDLFPTLYALALPGARVPWFGDDLLAPVASTRSGAVLGSLLLTDQGMADPIGPAPRFYQWEPASAGRKLIPASPSARLRTQAAYANAQATLQELAVRQQVLDLACR